MKLSTRARYGLRLCFLVGISNEKSVSLKTLVKQTNLSEKYLEQILSMLKKGAIMNSIRGTNGGYYLTKAAEEIKIGDILEALNDSFEVTDCVTGKCDDEYCPNRRIF